MFGWDDAKDDHDKVQGSQPNEASLGHEVIAGAASFYAMHEFEEHQRKEGEEVDHGFAKEMIAGFAGAGVDHLAETKGADFIDKEKAKHEAKQKSAELYDQHYGDQENYNPNRKGPHKHLKQSFNAQNY